MKPVRLSAHARGYLNKRGFTVAEVEEAIRTSSWSIADRERLQCRKNFSFNQEWNGKFYTTKQVKPIFVEKDTEIIVVTVYTYYF
ncbi:DUF4258 domain-containing protein [Oscillatoria salina]|uniref:DUF4258 domain-containing protein n=1 Tax=Oscillatoria salina TaxID=331517 RepID=UPI0013BB6AEB|nr:DUF4258 domain-containing protein [Oscillatoria salina]MBZ8181618.1 DUF4258 domain-containing protein [Oscillatoria salina IIICB1]NET89958.1 DUF4258 domain-containing protein [Kamptonema sp. SIO1D9]